MKPEHAKNLRNDVLNVWGAGQLLAFSALDGATDYADGLVLKTAEAGCGFDVMLPGKAAVSLSNVPPRACLLAGDFFELILAQGQARGAFVDAYHVLLEGPCTFQPDSSAITAATRDGRTLIGEAKHFDAALLDRDLDAEIVLRKRWLAGLALPAGLPELRAKTTYKALSVMKTQVCSPEGRLRHRWTTPDRWPHRDMWLWDSAFHALGWRHLDVALAREAVEAVFDCQRPDGMVPHQGSPTTVSPITQPPVLALAAELIDEVSPDDAWVARMYPLLSSYVRWDLRERANAPSGLLRWFIEDDPRCRSGESGMDNSPRFDAAQQLDAPDFSAFAACECQVLARFARRLGKPESESCEWMAQSQRLCDTMNERLWNDAQGLYMDCEAATGRQTGVLSSAGFLPLLCGAPSPEQAARLAAHLDRPETFGTAFPLASIPPACRDHYSPDMWRGPTWINVNWLVARGFDRYALSDAADRLRQGTLAAIERWYAACGALYEYYDTLGETPPARLLRKGRCEGRHPYMAIRDYGWTSTLYVDLVYSLHAGAETR